MPFRFRTMQGRATPCQEKLSRALSLPCFPNWQLWLPLDLLASQAVGGKEGTKVTEVARGVGGTPGGHLPLGGAAV